MSDFQKVLAKARTKREAAKDVIKESALVTQMLPYDYPILFPYAAIVKRAAFFAIEEAVLTVTVLLEDGSLLSKHIDITKDTPRIINLDLELKAGDLLTLSWDGKTPPRITLVVGYIA